MTPVAWNILFDNYHALGENFLDPLRNVPFFYFFVTFPPPRRLWDYAIEQMSAPVLRKGSGTTALVSR